MSLVFEAEIVEIKVKKTVSNDKLFRIVLETDNKNVLELQKAIADSTVVFNVEYGSQNPTGIITESK